MNVTYSASLVAMSLFSCTGDISSQGRWTRRFLV